MPVVTPFFYRALFPGTQVADPTAGLAIKLLCQVLASHTCGAKREALTLLADPWQCGARVISGNAPSL